MMKFQRVFMIVTDSLGIGGDELNQKRFGDLGANTLLHTSEHGTLEIPTWKRLGISCIAQIANPGKPKAPQAYVARVLELSNGKDTLTGHWEMMGIHTQQPFPVFTEGGFPPELINALEAEFDGRKVVCNRSISGTEAIAAYANQEIMDHKIIVYTSQDSTLQICGDEATMGLDKLYRYAAAARAICSSRPEWNVGRVIARPYRKNHLGQWERTFNRHDYAVTPPQELILDRLAAQGVEVISVGKINDIFSGRGIKKHYPSEGDGHGMDITIDLATQPTTNQFIFTNLVQFDSHYGHRRDVEGYANNINLFDTKLAKLLNALRDDDLLIITSDHGNDPTFPGFNHTRENLPATIYSKAFKAPKRLADLHGLGTLGNIVAKNFNVALGATGEDIWDQLI